MIERLKDELADAPIKVPAALIKRIQSLEDNLQILTRKRNELAKEIKRQEIVNEELTMEVNWQRQAREELIIEAHKQKQEKS